MLVFVCTWYLHLAWFRTNDGARAQVALFEAGAEALRQDSSTMDALREVAASGWSDEAKHCAAGAIMALSDEKPSGGIEDDGSCKHIMISYQCTALCFCRASFRSLI